MITDFAENANLTVMICKKTVKMTACLKLLYLKNQSFNESVDLLFFAKVLSSLQF